MILHVPTLLMTAAVVCCLIAGVQMVLKYRTNVSALGYWGTANVTGAAGALVLALRADLPLAFVVVVGNGLIYVWLGLLITGIRAFDGQRPLLALSLAAALASTGLLLISYLMGDNLGQRIVIGSLLIAVWCGVGTWIMLQRRPGEMRSRARLTFALLLVLLSLFYVARALGVAVGWIMPMNALSGSAQGLVLLASLALVTGWNFASLYLVLDRLASRDDLTGLLNRRTTLLQGRLLLEEARAQRHPLSVLMLDLDHFKTVNDRFGHQVGDAVLRRFAEVARQSVRAQDLIGRIGGEEFCVVLPGADGKAALEIGERLRTTAESELWEVDQCAIRATVTVGVSTLAAVAPDDAPSISGLIKEADDALYYAKAAGRNRVLSAARLAAGLTASLSLSTVERQAARA
ncbi:diguanylate cyclase [Xanthobacter sp. ZOL 2024]